MAQWVKVGNIRGPAGEIPDVSDFVKFTYPSEGNPTIKFSRESQDYPAEISLTTSGHPRITVADPKFNLTAGIGVGSGQAHVIINGKMITGFIDEIKSNSRNDTLPTTLGLKNYTAGMVKATTDEEHGTGASLLTSDGKVVDSVVFPGTDESIASLGSDYFFINKDTNTVEFNVTDYEGLKRATAAFYVKNAADEVTSYLELGCSNENQTNVGTEGNPVDLLYAADLDDAATDKRVPNKKYVDDAIAAIPKPDLSRVVKLNDETNNANFADGSGRVEGITIRPVNNGHAVVSTVNVSDGQSTGGYVSVGSNTDGLGMYVTDHPFIRHVVDGSVTDYTISDEISEGTNTLATGKAVADYVEANSPDLSGYLPKTGGTLTGNVDLNTGTAEPNLSIKRTVDGGTTEVEGRLRIDSDGVVGLRSIVGGTTVNNLYLEQTQTRFTKPLSVASGGVPQDGTVGQILKKGQNGAEWVDSIVVDATVADVAARESVAVVDDPANPTSGIVLKTDSETDKTIITGVGDNKVDEIYISDLDESATDDRVVNKKYVDDAIDNSGHVKAMGSSFSGSPVVIPYYKSGMVPNFVFVDSDVITGFGTLTLNNEKHGGVAVFDGSGVYNGFIAPTNDPDNAKWYINGKEIYSATDDASTGDINALATAKAVKDAVDGIDIPDISSMLSIEGDNNVLHVTNNGVSEPTYFRVCTSVDTMYTNIGSGAVIASANGGESKIEAQNTSNGGYARLVGRYDDTALIETNGELKISDKSVSSITDDASSGSATALTTAKAVKDYADGLVSFVTDEQIDEYLEYDPSVTIPFDLINNDMGTCSCSIDETGTVSVFGGTISWDSDLNTAYNTWATIPDVTVPTAYRPTSDTIFDDAANSGGTYWYDVRFNADGTIDIRRNNYPSYPPSYITNIAISGKHTYQSTPPAQEGEGAPDLGNGIMTAEQVLSRLGGGSVEKLFEGSTTGSYTIQNGAEYKLFAIEVETTDAWGFVMAPLGSSEWHKTMITSNRYLNVRAVQSSKTVIIYLSSGGTAYIRTIYGIK